MAPNRKRHAAAITDDGWGLLGELLQARRQELGYKFRPAFARERLPLTSDGNLNVRLIADIENSYRAGSYPAGTLRLLAQAYEVTYESVLAVSRRETAALTPVPPAAPAITAEPPGWMPPMTDPARIASARPYSDRIWDRLRILAGQGITDPDGGQLFGHGSPDAKTWDGTGARLDLRDRVWLIADLQRRDAGRRNGPEAGTGGA